MLQMSVGMASQTTCWQAFVLVVISGDGLVMGKSDNNYGFGPEVPHELAKAIDERAAKLVSRVSPLEIGLLRYPFAKPVKLKRVPEKVLQDHRTRYTKAELKRGQFFRVGDKYTFFMDHEAKARRERK